VYAENAQDSLPKAIQPFWEGWMGHYSGSCIATIIVLPVASSDRETSGVQIQPTDERITELCEKLKLAQESEVESLLCELRAALREHAQFVEYMKLRASNRSPSSAKAAD
jgi:hypothetical protein